MWLDAYVRGIWGRKFFFSRGECKTREIPISGIRAKS